MIKHYFLLLLTAVAIGQPKTENKVTPSAAKVDTVKPIQNRPKPKSDIVTVKSLSSTPSPVPVNKIKLSRLAE